MHQPAIEPIPFPSPAVPASGGGRDPLSEVLHRGARQLLIQAVEAEVAQWVEQRSYLIDAMDAQGRRRVVRNGYADERTVVTGLGPMQVKMRPRPQA